MSGQPQQTGGAYLRHLPLLLIVIVAIVGGYLLRDYLSFETLRTNREVLLEYRNENLLGLAGIFVGLYIVIVAFSLPGAAIASMTGGFLFGLVGGTFLNVVSATLGASVIFLSAKLGLGTALNARLDASEGAVKSIKEGLREHEINVLLLMRLVPAVPFFVANLLPALVGVGFLNFLWTTAIGIIPGAIVFTWIGVGLGEVFDRGETPDLSLLWEPHILGPILGLCVLAALPIIIKSVRASKDA